MPDNDDIERRGRFDFDFIGDAVNDSLDEAAQRILGGERDSLIIAAGEFADPQIGLQVLDRWATRITVALPININQGREFMSLVVREGVPSAVEWLVFSSGGKVKAEDVVQAVARITRGVENELRELADISQTSIEEEMDGEDRKFFDMGESLGGPSSMSTLASTLAPDHLQNHFPPEHINSRCVTEGNTGNRVSPGVGHVSPVMHLKNPEDIGGAGSEKVLMIHPETLAQLNFALTNPLNHERGNIQKLHGFKVRISPHIKEGEIFIVSPNPLTSFEADSVNALKGHITRLFNTGTPPPTPSVFSISGTKFRPGDVMDELVGNKKEPEDDREVKEKRRRLGDRRLRDGERQDDD